MIAQPSTGPAFGIFVNMRTNLIYVKKMVDIPVVNGMTNHVIANISAPVVNLKTNQVTRKMSIGSTVENVVVDPRRNVIYAATIPGILAVLNGSNNRIIARLRLGVEPNFAVLNNRMKRLYVLSVKDQRLVVVQTPSS
ncbi:YncE family protein [Paenibacillus sp. LjRoot153]|uniref:YncE family protein n=1 Tax=Paenibacillus sp. LjRoot153 TaxID=3342270 RepID=UPI003F4F9EF1